MTPDRTGYDERDQARKSQPFGPPHQTFSQWFTHDYSIAPAIILIDEPAAF
jgi:hypothetical protein